jgi:hypothetical protein
LSAISLWQWWQTIAAVGINDLQKGHCFSFAVNAIKMINPSGLRNSVKIDARMGLPFFIPCTMATNMDKSQ